MKNRKRKTSYAKQFQKWQKNLGPARSTLLILVIIIGALIGVKQVQVYRERTTYKSAEGQIEALIDDVSKFAPTSKEMRKYCTYSSEKFSKGSLGCVVMGIVTFVGTQEQQNALISKINSSREQIPWEFMYDNTKNLLNRNEQSGVFVYSYKTLTCGLSYGNKSTDGTDTNYDKNVLVVSYDCTGSALKEYY
ncbi:hypothetical protein IPP75_04370 [Candidatus Saccharibacteria bacterium]|nr:MAG: hypothetical protein IPP75_04370 [Candidatus Saccharibacteria bacterium]